MSGPDQALRTILLVASAVFVPTGLYYRVQSQRTGESLDRRQEGWPILLTLRPLALAAVGGVAAYVINPAWMVWSSIALPYWLRWAGLFATGSGMSLVIWVFNSLGKNLTDTVVTRKEHTLVTRGPYAWIRHPLYTAVGLITFGGSLVAANWFVFAAGAVVFFLLTIRTRREEAHLIARFGVQYSAYMQRTARYLPKWNSIFS